MKQNIYDHPDFFTKYKSLRDSGVTYNDFVEQPAMKSLIGELDGKSVLDIGCGTGVLSKYCIDQGAASVVAVDISTKMIAQAKADNYHQKIDYQCIAIEDLNVANQSFDLIISSLALHYIEDYESLVKKLSKRLIKNGHFIFSTEHPIVTARHGMNNWIKDVDGDKLHWGLDHYQDEGKREQHWYIDGVIKYHRTVSTLLNALINHKLAVVKIIEPQSIPEGIKQLPQLINEKRRPSFILIKSRKL